MRGQTVKQVPLARVRVPVAEEEEWPEYSKRKRPTIPKYLKVLPVIVVAGGLIVGAYFIFKPKSAKPHTSTAVTSSTVPAPQVSAGSSTNGSLIEYVSKGQDLNLSFAYPSDWTVTPPSGNNATDQPIILNSPSTTITSATGSSVTGKVTVEVRPGSATINELNTGNPVAAQASTQMAYTSPTANQYQYPYITFVHFQSGAAVTGSFEEAIITGEQTFPAGSPVTSSSLAGLDPIISASFYQCSTTSCAGTGSGYLSLSNATWQSNLLCQQVNTLFESFKLN